MTDPEQQHVLIVDDDVAMCEYLRTFLIARGYGAEVCHTAEAAVARFEAERPAAVLLDIVLPGGMDGLEALGLFRRLDREVPVIVISGQGRTATVVQAMKLGATDFVSKPFVESDLEGPLSSAMRQRQLAREVAALREQLQGEARYPLVLGDSPGMAEVVDLIARAAEVDVPVLVCGEPGTGKELVARALFAGSRRREKPFVKITCGALPSEILESELFGFERGAFAGAMHHKPGKFEFANHGTLFLDAVGDLSPALQVRLLHVVQDGVFTRPGGKSEVRVDVRVIAATSRDLDRAVETGTFLEELYASLSVVTLELPPLRERREEIAPLTRFFLKKYAVQYNKPLIDIGAPTLAMLEEYDWPGNVRELEGLVKRAVVMGSAAGIARELHHAMLERQRPAVSPTPAARRRAPAAPPVGPPVPASAPAAVPVVPAGLPFGGCVSLKDISRNAAREAERELIMRMLQHTRWNRKEAAEILGISYKALLYKIKENGLDKAS